VHICVCGYTPAYVCVCMYTYLFVVRGPKVQCICHVPMCVGIYTHTRVRRSTPLCKCVHIHLCACHWGTHTTMVLHLKYVGLVLRSLFHVPFRSHDLNPRDTRGDHIPLVVGSTGVSLISRSLFQVFFLGLFSTDLSYPII